MLSGVVTCWCNWAMATKKKFKLCPKEWKLFMASQLQAYHVEPLTLHGMSNDNKSSNLLWCVCLYFSVTEMGRVYSWGIGNTGALGHGNTNNQTTPQLVESLRRMIPAIKSRDDLYLFLSSKTYRCYSEPHCLWLVPYNRYCQVWKRAFISI